MKASTKLVMVVGGVLLFLLLVVASSLLYFNFKLQQGIFSREPSYSAPELYSRAVDQVNKGGYGEAEKYLEQALRQGESADYRNQLAVVKYRLKKYEESIAQYEKLIEAGGDKAFAYNGIGNAYRDWVESDAARTDEYRTTAAEFYGKALEADPRYVAAYSNLALMLANAGKTAEALEVADKGILATGRQELKDLRDRLSR